MSSFSNPHFFYLFALKSKEGKRKLAYGQSPEDAIKILSYRMTEEELKDLIVEDYIKIHQRELQEYIDLLA
ncbi:MAG TPA: hypothetical protein PLJ62_08820 [Thermoflexales bacterium]|nr:hypothetical protein [Thermoflexales bacterium]HQW36910.1 hypothetical protein [Thermoflexales bacterium]HQX76031.1 hypothetical protein [Thermoflexales bacterium]HQZ23304.1 hypothetical protein [Thermoflexales bacterium]HRA00288.1 hypothetical protein [Thermoflexales bacterium]